MAWDLDSLIDYSLKKASEIGALNRAERAGVIADATAKWKAELEGRKEVAGMQEAGNTGRTNIQYGLGGASDRGLQSHERVAQGQVGLGDRQIAGNIEGHRIATEGQKYGYDKAAATSANRLAAEIPGWQAATELHKAQAELASGKTPLAQWTAQGAALKDRLLLHKATQDAGGYTGTEGAVQANDLMNSLKAWETARPGYVAPEPTVDPAVAAALAKGLKKDASGRWYKP